MRPVSAEFEINQPFGSMATAGVVGNINRPETVEYYVARYGNYQPYGHAGCDFACPEGTPVRAIADGTVLWADWGTNLPGDESDAGYRRRWYLYKSFPGIVTIIQHNGWIGVYAHLSDAPLNPGDKVTEGQIIALSGATGGVAPHLHVEALVDLTYRTGGGLIYGRTNPEPFFGSATITTQSATIEEDDMALFASIEDFKAAVAEAVEPAHRVTRADTATNVLNKPVPYKDPATGQDTGQTTTLATMAGFADFQANQTRITASSAPQIAAQINAAGLAEEVRAELVKLIGGTK